MYYIHTTITMILLLCREIASVGKKIGLIFSLRSWDQDTWILAISFPIFELPHSCLHNLKLKIRIVILWFSHQTLVSTYSPHATNIMNEWTTFFHINERNCLISRLFSSSTPICTYYIHIHFDKCTFLECLTTTYHIKRGSTSRFVRHRKFRIM